ncbi:hypothetical protein E4K68_01510 [Desulfosporosinus sp. Sb-LF]|nr:hypothetical protein E4K68_01510 [Desulfosporosinus sp. Sb-LF]
MEIAPRKHNLLPSEVEALQQAISNDFMKDQGWSSDEQGRIKNNKGRTIFKPGFVTPIQKTLENNEK